MDDRSFEYLKALVEDRRVRIRNLIAQAVSDQRHTLLACGAFWSWRFGLNNDSIQSAVEFIPSVVVLFFMTKWLLIHMEVRAVATGIADIEKQMGIEPQPLLEAKRHVRNNWLGILTTVYWILVLITNLTLAFLPA